MDVLPPRVLGELLANPIVKTFHITHHVTEPRAELVNVVMNLRKVWGNC